MWWGGGSKAGFSVLGWGGVGGGLGCGCGSCRKPPEGWPTGSVRGILTEGRAAALCPRGEGHGQGHSCASHRRSPFLPLP